MLLGTGNRRGVGTASPRRSLIRHHVCTLAYFTLAHAERREVQSSKLTLRSQRPCGRSGGLQALQEPFVSPPGPGYARAWRRKRDVWGDNVSPSPSLRKVSS